MPNDMTGTFTETLPALPTKLMTYKDGKPAFHYDGTVYALADLSNNDFFGAHGTLLRYASVALTPDTREAIGNGQAAFEQEATRRSVDLHRSAEENRNYFGCVCAPSRFQFQG